MKSPITEHLERVLELTRPVESGHVADYIDVLAQADDTKMAVALATVDGFVYSAGDDKVEFSMQSISKAFVYAMAIEDVGMACVLEKVGVEPSGDAFNQLSLQRNTNRPMNPMINAGALASHSLVCGTEATEQQREERIIATLSDLAGRRLSVDEAVFHAELKDADRNMGLAYMLKAAGIITGDPRAIVRGYIRQCSVNVNVHDLAIMAATLSNAGINPVTGKRVMPQETVRQVLSVMTTCGMYDAAGDWVSRVGIPAKSGVAGGIIGALPGQMGLAVFSPKLDGRGNSVRGVLMCEKLSSDMGLHMMDIRHVARATVHTRTVTIAGGAHACEQKVPIFGLRGAVRFAGAERLTRTVLRELSPADKDDPGSGRYAGACAVVFSFTETYSLHSVAQRVIQETIRHLFALSRNVVLIDPNHLLTLEEDLRDRPITVVNDDEEASLHIGGTGCHPVSYGEGL
ncbi:glutaminase [Geosmithia morbida]|uniref:glutaminase n=1 Tax=Geosmithia morbida TaxID=1094350 RepID=A0A9P4YQ12_9HYPO|nr:glutaminase [Geosmithia morbida]KAF4119679.1 glutaminase [Geosmithia morbida]